MVYFKRKGEKNLSNFWDPVFQVFNVSYYKRDPYFLNDLILYWILEIKMALLNKNINIHIVKDSQTIFLIIFIFSES